MSRLLQTFLIIVIFLLNIPLALAKPATIKLYTSIPQNIINAIRDEFNQRQPDIELEIFRSGATGVESQIELELGSPKGLTADLVWVTDPAYLIDLKGRSILLKYESPEDQNLEIGKDPDGYYYGARLMTVVIAYNSDRVAIDDIPTSWASLKRVRYKGVLVIPDPLKSGTALDALAALSDKFGFEYYETLFKNGVTVVPKNGSVIKAILDGTADTGITLDYMVRQKQLTGEPISLVYPSDGFVVVPSPIAITASSKQQDAAKIFMDFILSKDGQEQMVKLGNFLPVRSDVYPPDGAPTINRVVEEQIPINWENLNLNKIRLKGKYFKILKEYLYYTEEIY